MVLSNYRRIICGDWNLVGVYGSLVSVSGNLGTVSPRLISLNRDRLHSVSLLGIRRCNEDLRRDCDHAMTRNSCSSSADIYDDQDEGDEEEDGREDVNIDWG